MKVALTIAITLILISLLFYFSKSDDWSMVNNASDTKIILNSIGQPSSEDKPNNKEYISPISIEYLRTLTITGSDITIEQTLSNGSNYKRYIASYLSDGYKIYGLLTVPTSEPPEDGYPAIVFNHGYIPPSLYVTTEKYVAYVDNLARNGFVVFKIDLRGHGNSEGNT